MVLDIKNVGKIEHATVKFDGITVVAGPNSSGKSTISKALYLMNLANTEAKLQGSFEKKRNVNQFAKNIIQELEELHVINAAEKRKLRKDIVDYIIFSNGTCEGVGYLVQTDDFADKEERENKYARYLSEQYEKYVNHDTTYYIKYAIQRMVHEIFKKQLNTLNHDEVAELKYYNEYNKIYLKVDENKVLQYEGDLGEKEHRKAIYISTSDFVDTMDSLWKIRQAVRMNGSMEMNCRLAELLLQKSEKDLTAADYEEKQKQVELFEKLLQTVVNGNILVQDEQLQYYDNDCHSNIEFTNMASGMKIFLILKRLIENGILLEKVNLIIDEPEANLHPEWQLKLAELLVLLYKNLDVRVYINSHSPYFVRAIEYYSNQYDIGDSVNFYTMEEIGHDGAYTAKEVTENVDIIYKHLSKPLSDVM